MVVKRFLAALGFAGLLMAGLAAAPAPASAQACGPWNNWCAPVQKCGPWNDWCGECGWWNDWCAGYRAYPPSGAYGYYRDRPYGYGRPSHRGGGGHYWYDDRGDHHGKKKSHSKSHSKKSHAKSHSKGKKGGGKKSAHKGGGKKSGQKRNYGKGRPD